MTKFRLVSDLHLESDDVKFKLDIMENEKEQVLLLAGDCFNINNRSMKDVAHEFLSEMGKRFRRVIMVAGNHEHWGSNIQSVHKYFHSYELVIDNFTFLEDDNTLVDDILIIGSTLWTDMGNDNIVYKLDYEHFINDRRHIDIRDGEDYRKFTANDFVYINKRSVDYINHIHNDNRDKKTIVMSHFLPSFASVNKERYGGENLNYCYANSNLDPWICDSDIDFWVHGHMHDSCDYHINRTNIICNPRGNNDYNKRFNHYKTFEL